MRNAKDRDNRFNLRVKRLMEERDGLYLLKPSVGSKQSERLRLVEEELQQLENANRRWYFFERK